MLDSQFTDSGDGVDFVGDWPQDHRVSLSWVSVASPAEAGLAGWGGELFVGGRANTQLPICSTLQWRPGLSYLPRAIRWVAGALGPHQLPFLTRPSFLSSIESVPGGQRVKQAERETKARCRAGAGRRKCRSCHVQPGPGSSSRWAGWCGTWRKGRSSTGSAWVLPSTWPQSSSTWQVMWTLWAGNPPPDPHTQAGQGSLHSSCGCLRVAVGSIGVSACLID